MVKDFQPPDHPLFIRRLTDKGLLRRTREIVTQSWCQGANALNAAGLPVPPTSPDAVSWCMRGAAIKAFEPSISVITTQLHHAESRLNQRMAAVFGFKNVNLMVQWNDTQSRTQQDVLDRIDKQLGGNGGTEDVEGHDEGGTDDSTGDTEDGADGTVPDNGRGPYATPRRRRTAA